MTAMTPTKPLAGASFCERLGRSLMDVILHLGAHRTATTSFQHYVRDHMRELDTQEVAFWGPQRVRKSIFPGLFAKDSRRNGRHMANRAAGRIRLFARQAQRQGVQSLLVSDENLLGTPISNFRTGRLYPAAGERTARVAAAFGGQVRRIILSIRSQDLWWASAAALTVSRGYPVPDRSRLDGIATQRRGWRDVLTDIACAAPGADITVIPFEAAAGRPDVMWQAALQQTAPRDRNMRWMNRSADLPQLRDLLRDQGSCPDLLPDMPGRWNPFTEAQAAHLREIYADDIHWLTAGADGLATLTEDTHSTRADTSPPMSALTRGQGYDKGHMATRR